jgi:hypothetical protein
MAFLIVKQPMPRHFWKKGACFAAFNTWNQKNYAVFRTSGKSKNRRADRTYLKSILWKDFILEFQRSKKIKTDFDILMLDMDFSKKVNVT